jgi:hypothetical protein
MKIEMSLLLFLTIMLWILDLSGAIDIAWYWIIAPFWLPFSIVLSLAILLTILYYIISVMFSNRFRNQIDQQIKFKKEMK